MAAMVKVSIEDVTTTNLRSGDCTIRVGTTSNCWWLSQLPDERITACNGEVPLETRRGIFFQYVEALLRVGHVTAHMNQRYQSSWISRRGPITWPPRSPDLTTLDLFLGGLIKEMTCRTKVAAYERGTAASDCVYAREHPEMIQWAVKSCLERARLCIENTVFRQFHKM
jgi:hypothetical protein